MILWENFDQNEIYTIVLLVVLYGAFFTFKKVLSTEITILFLVWGFAISTLFDFTIGGGMLSYYRVNDSNQYELTDLLSYFVFAQVSYFFVYFYKRFKIDRKRFIPYLAGWTVVGIIMEFIATNMKVTNYQNNYSWENSIIVFLVVITLTALYYELVKWSVEKR
ncbi:hypothetical protein [Aquisalibacillus elongatus]|uniref:Uncharacterized protein n=1 Tax=Aquisalibacillus elongatus TaxID=485577 RepID=A0A3N5BDE3_9BACI|nr:hypothetical protein [Aquisalibacillus elongatus]RPF53360.1 hypothetical protein EDC24_1859 [Aquisalibacillus elongatus]